MNLSLNVKYALPFMTIKRKPITVVRKKKFLWSAISAAKQIAAKNRQ